MKCRTNEKGSALLTLVVFVAIALSVITASVSVLFSNTSASGSSESGIVAYAVAESGAEEGYIQLLRNPSYDSSQTFSENLAVGSGTAAITVSNGTVLSIGTYANTVRKVQIQTTYTNGVFSIASWKEINP